MVKKNENIDLKFSKQFDLTVNETVSILHLFTRMKSLFLKLLNKLLNNCLYIQVWGEQVHRQPDPAYAKLTTRDFFEKEQNLKGLTNTIVNGSVVSVRPL